MKLPKKHLHNDLRETKRRFFFEATWQRDIASSVLHRDLKPNPNSYAFQLSNTLCGNLNIIFCHLLLPAKVMNGSALAKLQLRLPNLLYMSDKQFMNDMYHIIQAEERESIIQLYIVDVAGLYSYHFLRDNKSPPPFSSLWTLNSISVLMKKRLFLPQVYFFECKRHKYHSPY